MKDLPVKKTDEFLGEAEIMDLSALKDKHYIVAVNTGDPEKFGLLGSTVHGPYTFVEMVQEVGDMWATHQHHSKVIVLEKSVEKATEMLDPNTIDYIELRYNDIITEAMLEGAFDPDEKEFTCKAGLVSDPSDDPRLKNKEETIEEAVLPARTHNREQLRELLEKSTSVVGWWHNGHTVRGPFNRWFECTAVAEPYAQHVASADDDTAYAAAAMNCLGHLLEDLDKADRKIMDLQMELILMGRDPDAIK